MGAFGRCNGTEMGAFGAEVGLKWVRETVGLGSEMGGFRG